MMYFVRDNGRAAWWLFARKALLLALVFTLTCQFMTLSFPLRVHADYTDPDKGKISLEGYLFPNEASSLPSVPTGISAQGAVLINADTGEILYRQNENARLPMASTTKIMTALVAVEALPSDTLVTITKESVGIEGSSIYLTEGEVLTLEELLYALMLSSANDAAVAIAMAVSGSVEAFSERMNQKAVALGLKNTHFVNPHGLDDPEHYTTAYELAVIAKEAMSHDLLKTIISTERKTIPHNGEEGVRLLLNHNKLLRTYDGAVGVKTGFTKKSGRCLVSAAEKDDLALIAVTLNAPDDWRDHTKLLDYGFSLYDNTELCVAGAFEAPLWVIGGTHEYVMVRNREGLRLSLPKDRGSIRLVVEMPRFVYAPLSEGQIIGHLAFYEILPDGGMLLLGKIPLYAQHEVNAVIYKKSLLEKISEFFGF
ncbi:MAG: D-alanyl-D-alanine carboxypeptidase [Clostridia bacterium]|nr:D-alanyl-D-alanine carboxypeptidase [Clostridia bacterium]